MTSLEGVLLAILAVFYIMLLVGLGFLTLRNGRAFFFMLGIFLPPLWLVGALLPPTMAAQADRAFRVQQPPAR